MHLLIDLESTIDMGIDHSYEMSVFDSEDESSRSNFVGWFQIFYS